MRVRRNLRWDLVDYMATGVLNSPTDVQWLSNVSIYGGSYANLPLAQSLCDILMWLEKRLGITTGHFPKAFSTNSFQVSCDTTNKGSPLSIINSLRQQLPMGFKKTQPKSSILIQSSSNGLGNHLLQLLVDSPSILISDLFLAVEVCCLKVS
jgi:hypothetical protein